MLFAFICIDKPCRAELRQRVRAEHIEYMIAVKDRTVFGGPLQSDDGATTFGSVFAIDFADREAAERFIAQEPYFRNGLFESVQIRRWGQMVPETEEGSLLGELRRQRALVATGSTPPYA